MTDDKLKEVIELFAYALMKLGRAIVYDDRNKSQAHREVEDAQKNLEEIIEIVSK